MTFQRQHHSALASKDGGGGQLGLHLDRWRVLAVVLVVGLLPGVASAHPGAHARIEAASRQVESDPSPQTHLRRALLHLEHGDHDGAHADVERAEALQGEPRPETRWLRARIAFDAEDWVGVLQRLDKSAIADRPHALLMRARALHRLRRNREASEVMARALSVFDPPTEAMYLEAARWQRTEGDDSGARATLEDGLRHYPDAVSLELEAFRSSVARGDFPKAREDWDGLPAQLAGTPTYLVERARVEKALGDIAQADLRYSEARRALRTYPEVRRNAPALLELAAVIDREQHQLDTHPATAKKAAHSQPHWLVGVAGMACLGAAVAWRLRRDSRA